MNIWDFIDREIQKVSISMDMRNYPSPRDDFDNGYLAALTKVKEFVRNEPFDTSGSLFKVGDSVILDDSKFQVTKVYRWNSPNGVKFRYNLDPEDPSLNKEDFFSIDESKIKPA